MNKNTQLKIVVVTSRRSDKLKQPLDHSDIEYDCIDVENFTYFKRYTTIVSRVYQYVNQDKPDLILVEGADITGFLTTVLAQIFSIPIIMRLGGDPWEVRSKKRKNKLEHGRYISYISLLFLLYLNKLTFRLINGFIVVSDNIRESIETNVSCPASQIEIVPIHTDLERFQKTDGKLNFNEITTILTVTNLRFKGKYQGVIDIINEIEPLLKEYNHMEYVIAGGGDYLEELESVVETDDSLSSVRDQIHILGYVDEIERIYGNSDIFVYVSYTDGYPNVILEAQASGLPVVANNDHGIPMQIDNGVSGILTNPNQDGELRSAVAYLMNNSSITKEIGKRAEERVRQENSVESVAKKLSASLENVNENIVNNK